MLIGALIPPGWRLIGGAALVLALLAGLYGYGYHNGAARTEARWQADMAAEQTRQAAARAKALDAAVSRELARTAENEALKDLIDGYEKMLPKRPKRGDMGLDRSDVGELRKLQGGPAR